MGDVMGDVMGDAAPAALSEDERVALRAYLQRAEVRLSTVHRTATALLSGAGVLVLLPALGRDAIVEVVGALLGAAATPARVLLAVAVLVVLAAILVVIWLLLVELTRFYFFANHLQSARGATFTPRFTLTSLRLPRDELTEGGQRALALERADPQAVGLLVPENDRARRGIDRQIAAYEGLEGSTRTTDLDRADALLVLAGARDRDLLNEVVKIEYGMARHVLRIQVIVLRYVKALLVVLVSLLLMFALAAVVGRAPELGVSAERVLAALIALWAPAVLVLASSPIRWLGSLLRNEGAASTGIRYDRELTRLERIVAAFSATVLVLAVAGTVLLHLAAAPSTTGWLLAAVVGGALVLEVALLLGWGSTEGARD
jgi:hypothetical protein